MQNTLLLRQRRDRLARAHDVDQYRLCLEVTRHGDLIGLLDERVRQQGGEIETGCDVALSGRLPVEGDHLAADLLDGVGKAL
ncbi:hypothetical protein [Edwardsiella tarda]|uniref:hypothetical protein n=1 Tax=Edwardsiella tarda TaxID=636 RepID=UPI00351C65C4